MTRDYLESLGSSDEELDRLYVQFFGGRAVLVGEDSPDLQRARAHRWREVGLEEAGAFRRTLGTKPLGSFADDEPEMHAALRAEKP